MIWSFGGMLIIYLLTAEKCDCEFWSKRSVNRATTIVAQQHAAMMMDCNNEIGASAGATDTGKANAQEW